MQAKYVSGSNTISARWNTIVSLVLGVLAAILFISVLSGLDVPFAEGGMTSFAALAVISIGTCVANAFYAARFWQTNSTYWTNPMTIIGMVLGVASLLLIVFTLIGVTGVTMAFTVLGVIVFVKVGLKILQNAVLK